MSQPSAYRCNCGQEFPSHLARTAHAATCPVMQSQTPAGECETCGHANAEHGKDGRLVTQHQDPGGWHYCVGCDVCRAWTRAHPDQR